MKGAITALVCLAATLLSGCKTIQFGKAGIAPEIIHAQTPGTAEGAGATITGPANSAAPTTQIAERRATYFPKFPLLRPADYAGHGPASVAIRPPVVSDPSSPLTPPPVAQISNPQIPDPSAPAEISSTYERTETTFGQHQNASAIIQAAAKLEGLSKTQWAGILCIVGSALALLWCAGHDEGYPLVFWKVMGVGVVLLFVTNPWWLLLLLLPVGLYAAQKFGILRLPLP